MKRELKVGREGIPAIQSVRIARPIPMKRELKEDQGSGKIAVSRLIARPIPMKRELKVDGHVADTPGSG